MSWYRKLLARKYPYVVAEIEVSHEGSMDKARQIIDNLVDMGCDCVKFQSWTLDSLYAIGTAPPDLIEYAFTEKQYKSLRKYCGKRIDFACSVFSEEEADVMERVGVPFFKIGSGDLTHLTLIEHVAKKGKPIVLSTGMGTIDEIWDAIWMITGVGNEELVLLYCISLYPPKPTELNLHTLDWLSNEFWYPIGYSDHTMNYDSAFIATAFGVTLIETHYPSSLLVSQCRKAVDMLGHYGREICSREKEQRKKFRRQLIGDKFLRNPK